MVGVTGLLVQMKTKSLVCTLIFHPRTLPDDKLTKSLFIRMVKLI